MPTYQYEGMTPSGESAEGTVEAPSADEAQAQVRKLGVFVTRIVEAAGSVTGEVAAADLPDEESAKRRAESEDFRGAFQPAARRTLARQGQVGCFAILLIAATFITLLLSESKNIAWYWRPIAFCAAVMLIRQLLPRPWPDCLACGRNFLSLGAYCPSCGGHLEEATSPKRGFCAECEQKLWIASWSKCALWRVHDGRKPHWARAPVRFCTHCRVRLAD